MRDGWRPKAFPAPADELRRREYAERTVRQRLHQPIFRRQVLAAYRTQCALCRLRHGELLDAAHVKEDSDGGEPVVPNGIAMCAIHHRAFDSFVLGVRPDYVIEVRRDVLGEADSRTLRYARSRRRRAQKKRLASRITRCLRQPRRHSSRFDDGSLTLWPAPQGVLQRTTRGRSPWEEVLEIPP
jgi:hypothetical protein